MSRRGSIPVSAIAYGRDCDADRLGEDDTAAGGATFNFSVVDPPPFPYKLKITFQWLRQG